MKYYFFIQNNSEDNTVYELEAPSKFVATAKIINYIIKNYNILLPESELMEKSYSTILDILASYDIIITDTTLTKL